MRVIAIIAILYAAITEVLDWQGRAEIIEKRFPKTWAVIGSRYARIVLILFAVGLLLVPREGPAPESQPHVAPAASPSIPDSSQSGGSAQSSPPDKAEPKQPSQEPLVEPLPKAKPPKSGGPLLVQRSPLTAPAKRNGDIAYLASSESGRSAGASDAERADTRQQSASSSGNNTSARQQGTTSTTSTGQADQHTQVAQEKGTASSAGSQGGTTTAEVADAKIGDLSQTVANVSRTNSSDKPKRVLVLPFDYATVAQRSAAVFGTNVDIGKGIADLVAHHLAESGKYTVIDPKEVDRILAEQKFSNSDRANPTSAAELGKMLGADEVVIGSITQFGNDSSNSGGAGGSFGKFGAGGVGHKKTKVVVNIDARVVDLNTAEIETIAVGRGESSREGTSLAGGGGDWHGWGAGPVDFGSSNFQQTIIGEAVNDAVKQTSAELVADESKLPSHTPVVEGVITTVDGATIVLNIGRKNGLAVGDELSVERTTREIMDPSTGKSVKRIDTPVGVIKLTGVDDVSAVASVVSGAGFKVGDSVKLVGHH